MENFYKTNFLLLQEHHYSLSDIENMMPWEREIYINLLMQFIEEENNEHEKQKRQ